MSSVRRFLAVLTATVIAALTAVTPAFAGPAPLIEPAPAPAGGGSAPTVPSGSLDGWWEAASVTVMAVLVLAVVVTLVSRTRHHHRPSTA